MFETIIDEDQFEQLARDYQQRRAGRKAGAVLAVDGKRERGTIPPGESQGEALLAVYNPQQQEVVAQGRIAGDEGEIPAAQQVLAKVDLHGKIVVADALHTQRELSRQIVGGGGDYVWTVKENQPLTYQAIELLFNTAHPVHGWDLQTAQTVNKGHGRIEERTLIASSVLPGEFNWPYARQVFRLERTFTFYRKGQVVKVEHMQHYGLSSLHRASTGAKRLLAIKRCYW